MSAIATFHLLRNEDIDSVKQLATQPVGPGPKGKWRDPYHEFLVANARALEAFEWSGDVIGEILFYLESRSVAVGEYCNRPLTEHLARARGTSIYAFQAESARRLAQLIGTHWPDEAAVRTFLNSPDRASPLDEDLPVEAILAGLRILKAWLLQVEGPAIGLLTIG
jgi:hypothetical protein